MARTNTWSFSSDFIDGISQCLAQKEELNVPKIGSENKLRHIIVTVYLNTAPIPPPINTESSFIILQKIINISLNLYFTAF